MTARQKDAVRRVMKQTKLLRILEILSKYVEDSDELSCDAYSIYMSPGHSDIPEEDRDKLEELGVMWSTDHDCWMVFL